MQTLDLLFVYGSLLTGNAARQPFRPFFEAAGEGTVGGELYHLPEGYPTLILADADAATGAATADTDARAAGRVRGEVIRLRDPAAALSALDEYEGADPGDPEAGLYARVRTFARLDAGGDALCWIYVCPGGAEDQTRRRARRVDSGSWRAFLSGS